MDESDFEGTLVLERVAEIGKLESFFEAIDSDDFDQARRLMRQAKLDADTIAVVLKKMSAAEE